MICANMLAMKRTNYYFPVPLLDRLKNAAAASGLSMVDIIRRAVEVELKARGF